MMPSSFVLIMIIAAATINPAAASSIPIISPDINSCRLTSFVPASYGTAYNCCLLHPAAPPSLYRLPKRPAAAAPRRRRAAQNVDAAYAAKLSRAYALMKALPPHDPRSFLRQAHVHCAYCNAVYNQINATVPFQVHFSWLFLPFHRWYLYFHERILASLLGDDDLTVPFWNYDHPDGSQIPDIYLRQPHLHNPNRDRRHLPPAVAAIDYLNYNAPPRPRHQQLRENAAYFYRGLVRDSTSKYAFHGGPYRHGDFAGNMTGNVERYPHNTIHIWTGSVYANGSGGKDMGWFSTAGFDPLFYAHHAEIDRLWEIWLSRPGNDHIDDPDYLDTEFLFYDERAEMVRVKVRDALNVSELGYAYEEAETPWMSAEPVALSGGKPARLSEEDEICGKGELIERPCSVVVQRDAEAVGGEREEDLAMEGVKFTEGMPYILDVFLNLPTATAETTSGSHEYVGSVFSVPQFSLNMNTTDSVMRLKERVKALKLTEARELVVTFVPKGLQTGCAVSITSLSLQYPAAAPPVASPPFFLSS